MSLATKGLILINSNRDGFAQGWDGCEKLLKMIRCTKKTCNEKVQTTMAAKQMWVSSVFFLSRPTSTVTFIPSASYKSFIGMPALLIVARACARAACRDREKYEIISIKSFELLSLKWWCKNITIVKCAPLYCYRKTFFTNRVPES